MEYVSTYWWAVLIMVIVLALLFKLGLFNSFTLAAKAYPGACSVYRPYGKGSIGLIRLEGVCDGEAPEYVVQFNGNGGAWSFSCAPAGTCVNFTPPFPDAPICNFSFFIWSYDSGMGSLGQLGFPIGTWFDGTSAVPSTPVLGGVVGMFNITNTEGSADIEYNDTIIRYEYRNVSSRDQILVQGQYEGKWIQTGMTVSNGVATGYLNGAVSTPASPNVGCIRMLTGSVGIWDRNFNGYISNLQVYNTTLNANQVLELYQEGIGGAPIQLQNLAGWWPLNGNANDYSGNKGNGYVAIADFSGTYSQSFPLP